MKLLRLTILTDKQRVKGCFQLHPEVKCTTDGEDRNSEYSHNGRARNINHLVSIVQGQIPIWSSWDFNQWSLRSSVVSSSVTQKHKTRVSKQKLCSIGQMFSHRQGEVIDGPGAESVQHTFTRPRSEKREEKKKNVCVARQNATTSPPRDILQKLVHGSSADGPHIGSKKVCVCYCVVTVAMPRDFLTTSVQRIQGRTGSSSKDTRPSYRHARWTWTEVITGRASTTWSSKKEEIKKRTRRVVMDRVSGGKKPKLITHAAVVH